MADISLLQLPLDVLVNIFKKLDIKDLHNLILCCKTLRDIILNDNSIWREICRSRLILQNSSDNSQSILLSWYNRCRISNNWCKGIYRSKVLIHHHTNYMPWLKLHNSEALVLSVGSELHCYPTDWKGMPSCKESLWKIDVPKVKRYDIRTNDISRFVIKNNLIVCGNRDGCVAVYKSNDIRKEPHLLCHIEDCHDNGKMEVTAVELISNKDKSYVVTASSTSPQLRFWYTSGDSPKKKNPNLNKKDNGYHTLDSIERIIPLSENLGMRCLAVDCMEEKLAIGLNGNSKPLLLDVTTGELLMTADSTMSVKQAVRDIGWHNHNTIIFVTHSGKLQLIDIRNGEVVYDAVDPLESTLYCVKTDSDRSIVVGSSEYSRCVLFDSRNCLRHVQMYFTQKKWSPIYSLDFNSTKLVAAADRSVAVLNFNINVATTKLRDYSNAYFEFVNMVA